MLIVKGLSKRYDKHQILDEINLTFNKGEVHGLVGDNGAGKNNFIQVHLRLRVFSGSD